MEHFISDEPGVFQLAEANGRIDSFRNEIKHAIGYDESDSDLRVLLNVRDESTTHHMRYSASQRMRKQV